ncbi:phosphonate metabolism transcriptional regulator PhnF [Gymnodinialimonas sp. 2305UL16-5]|uniref:phosphonate metabolism transcriptional regulator PhnF n=1 Tax=Gymnodinialimonas mytili TaxID=3126503 RepID=UPI0030B0C07F
MGRSALWTAIRDTLLTEITNGHYPPGARLPTEAQLSDRFNVNRHTVRRALAALADSEIVHARRGAGVFVRHVPTPYPIGRRVRFHQNIQAAGHIPEKRVLNLETRLANVHERKALKLGAQAKVHIYEGVSISDNVPLAFFCSAFPAGRFPDMLEALAENGSVTAAFRRHGVTDYVRQSTEITGKIASQIHASLLELRPGDPILRTIGINVDAFERPIELGRTWFAADRVTLTLSETG